MLQASPAFLDQLYVSSAVTAFAITALLVYCAFRLAERAEAETEALLRNILPEQIVDRLKQHPNEAIAEAGSRRSRHWRCSHGRCRSAPTCTRSSGPSGVHGLDTLREKAAVADQFATRSSPGMATFCGSRYYRIPGSSQPHRRARFEAEQELPHGLEMLLPALDLLRHRVDVAEAPLERVLLEDRGRSGGVVGGVDDS